MSPDKLERYSFLWSEVRLVIAAFALLLGGVPPIVLILPLPGLVGLVGLLLTLSWILSGVTALYLLYRWFQNKQRLFGGKAPRDTVAFFILVVSGINLGIVGVAELNIGMSITTNYFVFVITALLYLASAFHLHKRWKGFGKKIF